MALLRGINVGGQKKFPKADQIKMLKSLGYTNTEVYLHTGNWLFETSDKKSTEIESKIFNAIKAKFGWEVPVLVRSVAEIETILESCPFSKEKKESSYFTLLHSQPSKEKIEETSQLTYPNEEFTITPSCVYFYSETGYGKAKMNNNFFESKLKVKATTRNFRTMARLIH